MSELAISRFAGLTVRSARGSLGWSQQASQLALDLVADEAAGEFPNPVPVGAPCRFECNGHVFTGLLQKFTESLDTSGHVYSAVVVDPREILEGVPVVTSSYSGSVPMPNLLNAYGYWESQGFGFSQSTPAGMPATLVVEAVRVLTNLGGQGPYGGPLNYKGYTYSVDLSRLPPLPAYYRLPTPSLYLMELVQQLCEDSGCDFYVRLNGSTIEIHTVSRFFQPPLGSLSRIATAGAYSGNCPRVEAGVEARNEVTSAFLIGGERTKLELITALQGFWGYDIHGKAVVGTMGEHPDAGPAEFMDLNATGVADVVGSVIYPCNTFEMRCALHSVEAWSLYVKRYKPWLYQTVWCAFNKDVDKPFVLDDIVDDREAQVKAATIPNDNNRRMRLFEFVKGFAQEYMGKQFLVRLPFVLSKQDAETYQITYSQEPTDAGYLPDGLVSFGLPFELQGPLLAPDERVYGFCYYPSLTGADTSRVNFADTVVHNRQMFARAQINPKPVFIGDVPCAIVKTSSPLFESPLDPFGNGPALDAELNGGVRQGEVVKKIDANGPGGTIGFLGVWPQPIYPSVVAVPMKSNILTYGPWFAAGAPGKVRFEVDQSLTPWDYGSEAAMEQAGRSRVLTAVTNQQYQETASKEEAGLPTISLGDTLEINGPNLTGIDIQISDRGITTTYRFSTFTPRFGLFSRQNSERMKRLSLAAVEARRNLRKALNKQIAASMTVDAAFRGWLANIDKAAKKQSPSTVFLAKTIYDSQRERVRVVASSTTFQEGLMVMGAFENGQPRDDFTNVSMMSVAGLIRPFSTRPLLRSQEGTGEDVDETDLLPCYRKPDRTNILVGENAGALDVTHFDPFSGNHDIEVVTSGDSYTPPHTIHQAPVADRVRGVALRGPVMIAGWAPGVDGANYPKAPDGPGYITDYKRRSDIHKVGPLDIHWDDVRGVYSSRDVITAKTPTVSGTIAGQGSGIVWVGGASGWQMVAHNWFSAAIPSNTRVMLGYAFNADKWYVIAADCV